MRALRYALVGYRDEKYRRTNERTQTHTHERTLTCTHKNPYTHTNIHTHIHTLTDSDVQYPIFGGAFALHTEVPFTHTRTRTHARTHTSTHFALDKEVSFIHLYVLFSFNAVCILVAYVFQFFNAYDHRKSLICHSLHTRLRKGFHSASVECPDKG